MHQMFNSASSFNQNIGGWSVAQVTNMHWMFSYASAFDQDLGGYSYGSLLPAAGAKLLPPVTAQDPHGIDQAAANVLRAKFAAGLFEQPYTDAALLDAVDAASHLASVTGEERGEAIEVLSEAFGGPGAPEAHGQLDPGIRTHRPNAIAFGCAGSSLRPDRYGLQV